MKYLLAFALLALCSYVTAASIDSGVLASAVTTTGAKAASNLGRGAKTFQGSMTVTSGSGTAAITIEGSLNGTSFDSIGTLSVTNTASDSITLLAPAYQFYRANVTGLTGTGAAATVTWGQ